MLFSGQRTTFAREGLVFKSFELGRDEPLDVLQGLAPLVSIRCLFGLSATDFDVIAVDAVVANFQRGQSGTVTLSLLKIQQVTTGVLADTAKLIQLIVKTCCNDAAISD